MGHRYSRTAGISGCSLKKILMRIRQFTTKDGETVDLGDFTVFVGPNNTGKSQTLLDIHSIMESNQSSEDTQTTIVEKIEYESQSFSEFIEDLTISTDEKTSK